MTSLEERGLRCPICQEDLDIEPIYSVKDSPVFLGTRKKRGYLLCQECHIAVLSPSLDHEEALSVYAKEYPCYPWAPRSFWERISIGLARLLAVPHHAYVNSLLTRPGKVLDVGCGNGLFLQRMKEKGWDVYGEDTSSFGRRETESRIGDNRTYEDMREIPDSSFDIATAFHVLEHLSDANIVADMVRVLKPRGILVIEVPNLDSFTLRLFGEHDLLLGSFSPFHTLYWSAPALRKVLESHHLTVLKSESPAGYPLTFQKDILTLPVPKIFRYLIAVVSIPFSLLFQLTIGRIRRTNQVIRVVARKQDAAGI